MLAGREEVGVKSPNRMRGNFNRAELNSYAHMEMDTY